MPTDVPDEVTTKEALKILGFAHPSSVTRMVAEGKLTPSRRLSLGYLFLRSDIEAIRDQRDAAKESA